MTFSSASLEPLRLKIRDLTFADQEACVAAHQRRLSAAGYRPAEVEALAHTIVAASRAQKSRQGTLDAFLQEFGLSNQEGVTLMCLAEALLRVPDRETQDALIAEKILAGDWAQHRGQSEKLFVNAGIWGLMLTGRILEPDSDARADPGGWLGAMVNRVGESAVRAAVRQSMSILGGQFVFGRSIQEALDKRASKKPGQRLYSFDMLGEGARTEAAAARYYDLYAGAIQALGQTLRESAASHPRSSISIKLSALHPRYSEGQRDRVLAELLPRVRSLAEQAASHDLPLTLDAEECDRLDLSLDLFAALAADDRLAGWQGLGLAVQAYQKRAPAVIDWLAELALQTQREIPVRLVKGAYWDTEIKHSQIEAHPDYPVYTRKDLTDLSYLACAQQLFAHAPRLSGQFATHNAHTIAAVLSLAGSRRFEFQRLHGMGELLYQAARANGLPADIPLRVYAPVGTHQDLLPYLVRRLLENGANSSFVHRFLQDGLPIADIVMDPTRTAAVAETAPLPAPADLYGPQRRNSPGIELSHRPTQEALLAALRDCRQMRHLAAPIMGGTAPPKGTGRPVVSPADPQCIVGEVIEATPEQALAALTAACKARPNWAQQPVAARAQVLRAMADALEQDRATLLDLLTREAGRTLSDAVAEWREAIDFCRYYATEAERLFAPVLLPGPTGEQNTLSRHARGVFLCISPWNFPLAIFTGQIAAALVCGNAVLAKPAEQTPLIAARATRLFLDAGVPPGVLALLPGVGATLGRPLLADARIAGVAFTGSVATAKALQRGLAARDGAIVPLIAETGGQNAMVVDSTALLEQACDDILDSAFGSAGQRCSALRVLLVQDDIADTLLALLRDALFERSIGHPWKLSSDIGPVIDQAAHDRLTAHLEHLGQAGAKPIARLEVPRSLQGGLYFGPRIYELKDLGALPDEVFGPILHVLRWNSRTLPQHLDALQATGFGLTFGVHSRLTDRQLALAQRIGAGNSYVNRGMTGAVVGVQPFGGAGLSGTGPKAGGPNYLSAFCTERVLSINTAAIGGNADLLRQAR